MAVQPDRSTPPMAECCATTVGGNTTIINGDEADRLDATIEDVANVSAPEGYREDDSHLMGAWREMAGPYGGS